MNVHNARARNSRAEGRYEVNTVSRYICTILLAVVLDMSLLRHRADGKSLHCPFSRPDIVNNYRIWEQLRVRTKWQGFPQPPKAYYGTFGLICFTYCLSAQCG